MLTVWNYFAQSVQLNLDIIARIIRLLANREGLRLLNGTYSYQVCFMIVGVITEYRGNDCQRMIGKLLIFLVEATKTREDLQQLCSILTRE